MEDKICKNCARFYQHYILCKDCCKAINCGHCTYGTPKTRKPDKAACEHFEFKDHSAGLPNRQEVIEFLTTDFLKKMMEKPLPPEIKEDEGFD